MDPSVTLNLADLPAGVPALTGAHGRVHAEAAAVCLENRKHAKLVQLVIRKRSELRYTLDWPDVTDEMQRCYEDLERATELGACGVAILLVRSLTGLTAVRMSKKGTGFDYWLGREDSSEGLVFANEARLEVSGILCGTDAQCVARLQQNCDRRNGRIILDCLRLPS
jgi:hypothetical protein